MISAHGTQVTRNGDAITEVGDITPPALQRPMHESTLVGENDETFNKDIRRYGELSFSIGVVADEHVALVEAWEANQEDDWAVVFTDGAEWTFAGVIESITFGAPVDGGLTAQVVVRPTEGVAFLGVLLQEDGGKLVQEGGGFFVL
jgi:hypothetical protein